MIYNMKVNTHDGMTAEQFGFIAEEYYQIILSPYRKKGIQSDRMYYFCLWGDTLRQGAKHPDTTNPCFDEFMTAVSLGKI